MCTYNDGYCPLHVAKIVHVANCHVAIKWYKTTVL